MLFGAKTAGYVGISVKDGDISGLINILMAKNIPLWNLKKGKEGFYFRLPLPYLPAVRRLAQAYGCYITVADRGGLPFFFKRVVKMRYVWCMALVVVGLLLLFTSSILRVEVTYEDGRAMNEAAATAILTTAVDHGLHPFMLKGSVDYDAVADAILDEFPTVSWVGFDMNGVTVTLRVAKKETEHQADASCGHIIATKNGVIREIFVLKGQKKVEIGDTVKTGDILISGLITYEEEGKEPVSDVTSAKGMVTAAVWYQGVSYVSLKGIDIIPTGEAAGIITATKDGETYTLWGSETNPFADSVTKVKEFPFLFGLTFQVTTFSEATAKEKQQTDEEAFALASKQAKEAAIEQIPADAVIIDEQTEKLTDQPGAVGIKVIIETEEDIGEFSAMK